MSALDWKQAGRHMGCRKRVRCCCCAGVWKSLAYLGIGIVAVGEVIGGLFILLMTSGLL